MSNALITLSGKGASVPDISKLDNFSAGLVWAEIANAIKPGVTFGELLLDSPEVLNGLWDDIYTGIGNVKDAVGGTIKDAFNFTGEKTKDILMTLTDEQILDAASRAAMAYSTGGTSEAAKGPLDTLLSTIGGIFKTKVSSGGVDLGAVDKSGMEKYLPWALGGIGLIVVLKLMSGSGSRGRR